MSSAPGLAGGVAAGVASGVALRVETLGVRVVGRADVTPILDRVSFTLARGSSVGLVGASGAGKSTLGLALLRLLPRALALTSESRIQLGDQPVHQQSTHELRALRGRRIAMVFQEPLLALNPAMTIGAHLEEAARVHGASVTEARERARTMLDRVGIASTHDAARRFPHEFSGGMRQRVLIACAMLHGPELLIADEPTTALDPTIQAQILDLLDRLREEAGTTLLLISHDLAVVGERCERVLRLDAGRLVDDAPAATVLGSRRVAVRAPAPEERAGAPLLEVRDLAVDHAPRGTLLRAGRVVHAVHGLSLTVRRGEVVGLVGESGCGKTSAALAMLRLIEPAGGALRFDGADLLALRGEALRQMRRRMQLVPQDIGASLTPHLTAGALVAEGILAHELAGATEAAKRARQLLDEMELPARAATARAHELSSGERQRVAIARALAVGPDLLICDEPVAALDESTREAVLELLQRLRRERGLALLLISHDLPAVQRLASRIAVMYLGRIVEESADLAALTHPRMPYSQALVAAVPTGDPNAARRRVVLSGDLPWASESQRGCAFHPRCPHPAKDAQCLTDRPELTTVAAGHQVACWKVGPSS